VLDLIEYRCRAEDAVTLPRVGTFPHNPAAFLTNTAIEARASAVDPGANWLDPLVPGWSARPSGTASPSLLMRPVAVEGRGTGRRPATRRSTSGLARC